MHHTLVSLYLYVKLCLGKITFSYENASRTCFLVFIFITVFKQNTFRTKMHHTLVSLYLYVKVFLGRIIFRTKMYHKLVSLYLYVKLFLGKITFSYQNASCTCFLVFISKIVFRQNYFFAPKCITLVFLFSSVKLF